jgi:hypothetical protein
MSYRVIQWATGAIGKTCLRQIIDHPDLELAGVLVYSEAKAGKDAGEIARRPPTGIRATRSVDEIVATPADVVLYTPLNAFDSLNVHDDNIQRLLRSGKNVITTTAHTYPYAHGAHYARRFEDACRQGGATLFGTGINPGFMGERLSVALTTICTKVDRLTFTEIYDVSTVRSGGFLFELMGIGKPLEAFRVETGIQRVFRHIFTEVVGFVGHALKVDYDDIVADHEFGIAERDVTLPAGKVHRGTVINFRWRWHGRCNGVPLFTAEMLWIADRTLPGWDYKDGWNICIRGAPGVDVRIDLVEPENMPDRSKAMQYAVAAPVIRAIPDVVKAPPGILLPPTFAAWSPRM